MITQVFINKLLASRQHTLEIEKLSYGFYVRKNPPDEDRVVQFGVLYEAKEAVPAVVVCKLDEGGLEVVDGRTRIEGLGLIGVKTVKAVIAEHLSKVDRIELALRLNSGGSLPATVEDYKYVIKQFIAEGESTIDIVRRTPWPAPSTREYIKEVRNANRNIQIRRAISIMTDNNIPLQRAAETFELDPEILKDALRKKKKVKVEAAGLTSSAGRSFRAWGTSITKYSIKAEQYYEDGLLSAGQVTAFLEHMLVLTNRLHERQLDRRNRFSRELVTDRKVLESVK